jgi:biotin synthase
MSDRLELGDMLSRVGHNAIGTGRGASREEALQLARNAPLDALIFVAGRVREAHFGKQVYCCTITNIKSGSCSEDCTFCAQSSRYGSGSRDIPRPDDAALRASAREACKAGVSVLGLVASGCGPAARDIPEYCRMAAAVSEEGLGVHASLGVLEEEGACALAGAGVTVYNHNLETARSFFPQVCSTHNYDARLATLQAVAKAGMERCCGGIFGVGEDWEQRVELGAELQKLGVERVPINFLHPVPGTPLGDRELLPAEEALRIVAIFRLMLPERKLQVCGGRELVLGSMQPLAFCAGATGVIIGDYLTTKGQAVEKDLKMISDLGLELAD